MPRMYLRWPADGSEVSSKPNPVKMKSVHSIVGRLMANLQHFDELIHSAKLSLRDDGSDPACSDPLETLQTIVGKAIDSTSALEKTLPIQEG
jgi:hypothetical protein